jgi:hypothetical protein
MLAGAKSICLINKYSISAKLVTRVLLGNLFIQAVFVFCDCVMNNLYVWFELVNLWNGAAS